MLLVYFYSSAHLYCHLTPFTYIVILCSIYSFEFYILISLGSKASSSKQVAKPLDNIKKEFINKLQNKNPMLSLDNSMDSLDTLGPDVPMLDPELMSKRK